MVEPIDGLVVRDAQKDEVLECTPLVVGHRLVVASGIDAGAADVGNLDVDDRLISDEARNRDVTVGKYQKRRENAKSAARVPEV